MSLRDEVTELLRELIRMDTRNPPGNETIAAEFLRAYFERNGVDAQLIARDASRANIVARVAGGDGPSLLLLSHTDTVIADPAEWTRDPWSGDVVDGEVWGRGALDMKGQVAAAAVAVASLAREGASLPGDLLYVSVADEEVGVGVGAEWITREHPDAVRADFVINEGGGDRIILDGRPYYACTAAEKMSAPFRLVVRGRSGHASVPSIADNALVKAARAIDALSRFRPVQALIPEVDRFLTIVLGDTPPLEEALDRARALDPMAAELIEPLLSMTLSPTMIHASDRTNVIPGTCEVVIDCRILPGETPADVEPAIRAALGNGNWELEWTAAEGGSRSPLDTPLWRSLASFVERIEPNACLIPACGSGFTDSHWFRERLGSVAYGFFPMRTMPSQVAARLVHSADERVPIDDLELAVAAYRHVALTLS